MNETPALSSYHVSDLGRIRICRFGTYNTRRWWTIWSSLSP